MREHWDRRDGICGSRLHAGGSGGSGVRSRGADPIDVSEDADGETCRAIGAQPDGHIVAAGYTYGGSPARFVVARFDRNGLPDPTFGSAGVVLTSIGARAEASSLVLFPAGDVVVGGFAEMKETWWDFALVRDP